MFLNPDLRETRPLMVVGAPRCGTRFVANALNRHPAIVVHGEIPKPAMENAIRFLRRTDKFFATVPQWSAAWQASQRELLYCMWASMVKGKQLESTADTAWFGHKTPRHDRYWKFYREVFGEVCPKYVFCMRNFVDHYLSMHSMCQDLSIANVARKFRGSVARYAEMKATLGDNVSLFILDDLREGGIDYVRTTLFEGLDIEVERRALARINVSRQANSTEGHGRTRRRELTADESAYLEVNQDLMEGLDAVRAARPLAPAVDRVATLSWIARRFGRAKRVGR
jgi:Sulfotransferase family